MVAQLYNFIKNHWIVHLQWGDFMVCKFYLDKAVQKNKPTENRNQCIIVNIRGEVGVGNYFKNKTIRRANGGTEVLNVPFLNLTVGNSL